MLKIRLILGTVFVLVVLALLLLDAYLAGHGWPWGPAFFALVGLVAVGGVHETASLLRRRGWNVREFPALAASLALLAAAACREATGRTLVWHGGPLDIGPTLTVITALVLFLLVAETLRVWKGADIAQALETVAATLLTVLYVGVLLLFAVGIRFFRTPDGYHCLLVFLAVAKASDIGAYFAGRAIGRRKLCPRLSPSKTVEGTLGGFVAAVAVSLLMGHYLLRLPWWQTALFGAAVCAFAMLGDLAESLIKRAAGAKDSGNAFPAFGGVLDIIDSVLVSAPVAYLLLALFGARHAA